MSRLSLPQLPANAVRVDYEKKEKCGVMGVWGHPRSAHLVYTGLYAQQQRGQESAGIASTDGVRIDGHVGMGLVPEVFNRHHLNALGEMVRRGVGTGSI